MTQKENSINWSLRYNLIFGVLIVVLILANVAVALEWLFISRLLLWILNMVTVGSRSIPALSLTERLLKAKSLVCCLMIVF